MGSKLEDIGLLMRNKLLGYNVYDSIQDSDNYNVSNSRALSDDITPIHGKGNAATDIEGAVLSGGGFEDINGNTNVVGSGRIKLVASNTYNQNKTYVAPDISKNQ